MSLEKRVLKELQDIQENGPDEYDFGLCSNIRCALGLSVEEGVDFDMLLERLFEAWPKYSGDPEYPVPSPDSEETPTPRHAYAYLEKWSGRYGDLRKELLDFCILALIEEQ